MNREDIFVGQTVKDGDEIVTVKEIFQQQNQSSSNDILVEDANGVSYSIYHEFLDFDDTAVNFLETNNITINK